MLNIRRAYPDLGKCLYFDLTTGSHTVLFELPRKRLNWLWYIHQPEPELEVINTYFRFLKEFGFGNQVMSMHLETISNKAKT